MHPRFTSSILHWYECHGRSLPWRQTRDAYRIWVSEIILQQTRVEQGRGYYERFLNRFPTVEALAAATEDEVMRQWEGLGYYSRARNLHAAAAKVVTLGAFPQTYDQLLAMPGVGEYTAAAIASFAYDEPQAVVDGNVYRVLARYCGEEMPIDTTFGKRLFAQLAREMMDDSQPARYNQAIMDFGALQCTPQQPHCDSCPLVQDCQAYASGRVAALPVKSHRSKVTDRYMVFVCMEDAEGRVLLQRRTMQDIWKGLYQFFLLEANEPQTTLQVKDQLPVGELTLLRSDFVHQLTHRRLHADFYHLRLTEGNPELPGQWVRKEDVHEYAMPRLLTKMLEESSLC